jgi:hypothetical protein
MSNLTELTERILKALRELSTQYDVERYRNLTNSMMSDFHELGLLLNCKPTGKLDPHFKSFFGESTTLLISAAGHIVHYGYLVEDWFYGEWAYEEWVTACSRRSALAFLFDLYRDTAFHAFIPSFQERLDTIAELLRHKIESGVLAPYDQIPAGTPASHWWWWYPMDPPPQGKEC